MNAVHNESSHHRETGPAENTTSHHHHWTSNVTNSTNQTCGGSCTINVPNAGLNYWWPGTYTYAASSLKVAKNSRGVPTAYSLVSAPIPLNVTSLLSAIAPPTNIVAPVTAHNTTYVRERPVFWRTPAPVAASTSVVSRNVMSPIPTSSCANGTGTAVSVPPLVITDPPPPTAVITGAAGQTNKVVTSSNAFLYFSFYEVISEHQVTESNGYVKCVRNRRFHNISEPVVHSFYGDPNGVATATGVVPPKFMNAIPQSSCVPGNWTAQPTVIVVVDITYYKFGPALFSPAPVAPMTTATTLDLPVGPNQAGDFLGNVGSSDGELVGPSATATSASTASLWTPATDFHHGRPPWAAMIAHYESTALSLEGPTIVSSDSPPTHSPLVAHLGSSALTIIPDAPVTSAIVTLSGHPVPATLDTTLDQAPTPAPASHIASVVGQAAQTGSAGSKPAGGIVGVLGQGSSSGKSGQAAGGNVVGVLGQGGSSGKSGPAAGGSIASVIANGGSGNHGSGSNSGGGSGSHVSSGGGSGSGANSGGSPGSHAGPGGGSGSGTSGGSGSGGRAGGSGSSGSGSGSSGNSHNGSPGGNAGSGGGSGGTSNGAASNGAASNGAASNGRGGAAGNNIAGSNVQQGSGSGQAAPRPVITVGGSQITAQPVPQVIVGGRVIQPGAPAVTIGGKTVSIPSSGNAIVVDGTTRPLPAAGASPTAFNAGGIQVSEKQGPAFVIDGQTVVAGGPAIVAHGTTISMNNGAVFVGGSSIALNSPQATAAGAEPHITINGHVYTANAAGQYVLGPGQTLTPGGTATMPGGSVVSLGAESSFYVVDGKTSSVAGPAVTPAPSGIIRGVAYGSNGGATYVIGGQMLTPGGHITYKGSEISLGPSGNYIVVDGVTTNLAGSGSSGASPLTIGRNVYRAEIGSDAYVIDGQTLTPGGQLLVHGTTVSLLPGGSAVVVNGVTSSLSVNGVSGMGSGFGPPVLTFDGQVYTDPGAGAFVIDGQTLNPGSKIVVHGTTISLAPSDDYVVINGVTSPLAAHGAFTPPVLTISGHTYTALAGSDDFVIDGQTLSPGGQITVSGTTISLSPNEKYLVVNGVTQTLSLPSASLTALPLITFEGQVYTADADGTFVIDGQTLTAGGVITVDGIVISLSPNEQVAVVGGITETLSYETMTQDGGASAAGASITAPTAAATKGATLDGAAADKQPAVRFAIVAAFVLGLFFACL